MLDDPHMLLRKLVIEFHGTGSNPPACQGWQRPTRRTDSHNEQDGWKRQVFGGSNGEIAN
jgi:hypothetical protein